MAVTVSTPSNVGASFRKGGGYGGSWGGGLDQYQIPFVVYAVVYGLFLISAIAGLCTQSRRSYVLAFPIVVCLLYIGVCAAGAVGGIDNDILGPLNVTAELAVFICMVHIAMESARASAIAVGKNRQVVGIVCLAMVGDIFAIVQAGLYALLLQGFDYDTVSLIVLLRAVGLALVLIVSMALYIWGVCLKGMSTNHKWIVPTCFSVLFILWVWKIGYAVVLMLDSGGNEVFLNYYISWTWGMLPQLLVVFFVVGFWKPNRDQKQNHYPQDTTYLQPLNPYRADTNVSKPDSFTTYTPASTYQQGNTYQDPYQQTQPLVYHQPQQYQQQPAQTGYANQHYNV